jgi:acetyl-CoA carboxylase carboxyl transferase subunit alpha
MMEMMALKTPILSVFIGEGGSGGAIALAVADEVWMMENAVYSVISPEGCASILWKDSSKAAEAAECLKMTSNDLFELGVIERILREPTAGDQKMFESLKLLICRTFEKNLAVPVDELTRQRYNRFRKFGAQ